MYFQPFRMRLKHRHPLGSQCLWEDALSSSGCLKVLPKRKERGQKGVAAEDDIGLALFSFHSCSQQLCLNWLVPFSAFVLLYRNKSSTWTNRNCSCCANVRKEQLYALKKKPKNNPSLGQRFPVIPPAGGNKSRWQVCCCRGWLCTFLGCLGGGDKFSTEAAVSRIPCQKMTPS